MAASDGRDGFIRRSTKPRSPFCLKFFKSRLDARRRRERRGRPNRVFHQHKNLSVAEQIHSPAGFPDAQREIAIAEMMRKLIPERFGDGCDSATREYWPIGEVAPVHGMAERPIHGSEAADKREMVRLGSGQLIGETVRPSGNSDHIISKKRKHIATAGAQSLTIRRITAARFRLRHVNNLLSTDFEWGNADDFKVLTRERPLKVAQGQVRVIRPR
jgi:hypothetical protein